MRNLIFLAVTLLASACATDGPVANDAQRTLRLPALTFDEAYSDVYDDTQVRSLSMSLDKGTLKGNMPSVGSFDRDAVYGDVYLDSFVGEDRGLLHVAINAEGDGGWAMVGATFDVDEEAGTMTYRPTDIMGCSGDRYDDDATDGDIEIEDVVIDGEDFVKITISGDFRGNRNVVGVATLPVGE